MPRAWRALGLIALVSGCEKDPDVEWRQFNSASDTLSIEIAPGDAGAPLTVDLRSNTGAVVVGSATVDPARAPVGTDHTLLIEVLDTWEDRIGRATITSDGARGLEEYDLRQDSADRGFFDLTLTSLGEEGESRTDVWTVTLWEPITNPLPDFEEEEAP